MTKNTTSQFVPSPAAMMLFVTEARSVRSATSYATIRRTAVAVGVKASGSRTLILHRLDTWACDQKFAELRKLPVYAALSDLAVRSIALDALARVMAECAA
jgi:hypothetical protein